MSDGATVFRRCQFVVASGARDRRVHGTASHEQPHRAVRRRWTARSGSGTREGELLQMAERFPARPKGEFSGLISGLVRGPGLKPLVGDAGAGLVEVGCGSSAAMDNGRGTAHRDAANFAPGWRGNTLDRHGWRRTGLAGEGHLHSVNDRQGLGDNFISQILEDDQGNLWLGGNRGISRVSKTRTAGRGRLAGPPPSIR